MVPHSSDWQTLTVEGAPMRAFVARPTEAAEAPGVLVIQHAGGVDPFVQGMTRRLAAAGFVAAAPELYHRQDPPPEQPLERMALLRDRQIIADCAATLDYLSAGAGDTPRPVGIVGFCMGGRVAYLMAAASDRLHAAVAFYGGNTRVAWGEGAAPFDRLGEITCPVLGFFGGRDTNPSPEDRDAIDAELTRHGVEHRFVSFSGAGHGYMDFTNATRYHTEAATESWPLTLQFFGDHLAAGSRGGDRQQVSDQ